MGFGEGTQFWEISRLFIDNEATNADRTVLETQAIKHTVYLFLYRNKLCAKYLAFVA